MHFPLDVEFAEAVASRLPVPAEIIRSRLTARELLALIGALDVMVAMRLHALLFGALCHRPLVAISYDPKVVGLMGELGLPIAASTDKLDSQALANAIIHAWQAREEISGALPARVDPLIAAARQNIELALSLLSRRRPTP
jgi:polysaccharide pyruvyl transferase WcaK-like protein